MTHCLCLSIRWLCIERTRADNRTGFRTYEFPSLRLPASVPSRILMVTSPQVGWLFFKAVRAGLAVKRPYLSHAGRASPEGCVENGRRLGETYQMVFPIVSRIPSSTPSALILFKMILGLAAQAIVLVRLRRWLTWGPAWNLEIWKPEGRARL